MAHIIKELMIRDLALTLLPWYRAYKVTHCQFFPNGILTEDQVYLLGWVETYDSALNLPPNERPDMDTMEDHFEFNLWLEEHRRKIEDSYRELERKRIQMAQAGQEVWRGM